MPKRIYVGEMTKRESRRSTSQRRMWIGSLKNGRGKVINLANTRIQKNLDFTTTSLAHINKSVLVCAFNCANPNLISPFDIERAYRSFERSPNRNLINSELQRVGFFRILNEIGAGNPSSSLPIIISTLNFLRQRHSSRGGLDPDDGHWDIIVGAGHGWGPHG